MADTRCPDDSSNAYFELRLNRFYLKNLFLNRKDQNPERKEYLIFLSVINTFIRTIIIIIVEILNNILQPSCPISYANFSKKIAGMLKFSNKKT